MELFKSFVSESEVKPLTVASGKIHQTQRNELKESATVGLLDLLQSNGVDAFRTISGVTMVIDNTVSNKTIYITLDPVIKGTNYDLDDEIGAYETKVAERVERERKLAEKKALKATPPNKE